VLAYWRERFPISLFLPIAIGLAATAQRGRSDPTSFAADVALTLVLLAQARLWDDLADRHSDASRYPNRVLVRATSILPLAIVCAGLAGVTLAIVLLRPNRLAASLTLGLLYAVLSGVYALRTHRTAASDLLLLAKYPAFVLLLAHGRWSAPTLGAMLAVFLTACLYEALHDNTSPLRRIVRPNTHATCTGGRVLWP
jgi:hypothetical protein